ncbi:MAG: helicase-related protein, partial [Methylococcales bacterium]
GYLRKPLIGKTIVFAVNKRHAETLAQMFDDAFRDRKASPEVRYADYVVSGAGQDDTLDGLSKIRRFKKEAFPNILVSVNMLDTGFDCPEVVNLIFARFTRSTILYRQMRGRGTRKIPGKPVFTLFDFVGVADYHGDDDDFGEGGVVSEKPKIPKYQSRRLLAIDVHDQIDPATREWITVDENGNMIFPGVAEQKAAEIGVCFEAWLLAQHDLSPDEERWLRAIGQHLRANAGMLDQFTADHFAFHPFNLMGGRPRAIRVFGGEDRLYALLIGLNDAVFGKSTTDTPFAGQHLGGQPFIH